MITLASSKFPIRIA
jgi:N6-adenosine-specific RNA methylase IME4